MKKLHFDYYMNITYETPVTICHYTIKCIPADTDRQHLEDIQIELMPENKYQQGADAFGNRKIYGCVHEPHTQFSCHITGTVTNGIADYESQDQNMPSEIFRYPHGLTCPGDALKAYFNAVKIHLQGNRLEQAAYIMHRLYQDFTYEKGVTDVSTSAEQAWILGRGVCQDYAHIMVALCRLAGIPARYAAGMLIGEGYSHAWVEICSEGRWYALDPTNDVIVADAHIKLGIGRDAADCMINRGVMFGGGSQTLLIRVNVE